MKTVNELAKEINENAVAKGWYGIDRRPLEFHMLVVSEIAEATEEVRNKKPSIYVVDGKPEGEAVELADAVIRILDYFHAKGWDAEAIIKQKMDYNSTRPFLHGGKAL